ncbi:MAG TPA: carboxypeptidase-like regulatory domain-containing protein [Gemmatimonadaceae bacterium]|nr:carboxypeptidase-like regulatory domain-containing protein [Gemmatimonadaceae bacterium]
MNRRWIHGCAATTAAPRASHPALARAALLVVLCTGAPLGAQDAVPTGRLEGTIKESVRSRPVRGSSITLARLDPEPVVSFGARPDDRGRYRLDSLPAGRYMIQLTHEMLDSLDLALPTDEVNIVAGQTARAQFSLPSSVALRNAVCRGLTLATGTGAVAGRVANADTDLPLANADVAISWTDMSVDRKTLRSSIEEHTGWVRTGPRGEYRICNVPVGSWLLIQLQYAGRASNVVRVSVSEDEGVIMRNLSLSVDASPTLGKLDSIGAVAPDPAGDAAPEDASSALRLAGTATVTGTVRGAGGRPVSGVELRVVNASSTTRTDDLGRYTLGGLPAGTQLLLVRRIGYLIGDVAVELRPGKSVIQDVTLQRVVSLDSMRVIAQRARYAEFEENRKNNPFGRFLTLDQIEQRHALEVGQLLEHLAGFSVRGSGPDAVVYSNSARASRTNCREANVVIDGSDHGHINYVPPREVAAIEAYAEAAGAPGQYRAECGLIVIWTKKYRKTH